MKNKLLKTLFILPAMLLGACAGSNHSSSNGEENSSSEKLYPPSVMESKWGLEAAKASYDVLGVAVPYIENKGFEYVVGVDDFGDPDIWFYAYYDTDAEAEEAYEDYLTICSQKGYEGQVTTYHNFDYDTLTIIEFEYCVVDRVIGEHQGVELQFLPSIWNSRPCLGIYGFSYLYIEKTTYPQLAVETFYNDASDVPVITGDYEYYFTFFVDNAGTHGLEIQVLDAYYDIEKWYTNELLKSDNYLVMQYCDYDDDYEEIIEEYEDFMYGFYYYAMSNSKLIIYYMDIENSIFVIDMYARKIK